MITDAGCWTTALCECFGIQPVRFAAGANAPWVKVALDDAGAQIIDGPRARGTRADRSDGFVRVQARPATKMRVKAKGALRSNQTLTRHLSVAARLAKRVHPTHLYAYSSPSHTPIMLVEMRIWFTCGRKRSVSRARAMGAVRGTGNTADG